jgi:putative ABC transport system permease protein
MFLSHTAYALRVLRKSPGFAALAILILAVGIAANTVIISVVDAVLLRPLPYRDSDRLVMVWQNVPTKGLAQIPVSEADFADIRHTTRSFEAMSAIYLDKEEYALTGLGDPEQVRGMAVSANLFSVLGVTPFLGRAFSQDEDEAGHDRKVIVSYGFWQRYLGGDRECIGRSLTLDGQAYSIIGVLPRDVEFPPPVTLGSGTIPAGRDLWVPLVINQSNREYHPLGVIGRLQKAATLDEARVELTALSASFSRQYPATNAGVGTTISPLQELVVRKARAGLFILAGAVGCVLLIACVNITNLLLTRSTARRKELAVRAALGASRGELIVETLVEHMLLAVVGGSIGVVLAVWGVTAVRSMPDLGIPRLAEMHVDWSLLASSAALSLLSGTLIGALPAVTMSRVDIIGSLRDAGRVTAGLRQSRLRDALAVVEIGLALVLLVAGGLLTRSFARLLNVHTGFQSTNVLTADVRLARARYTTDARIAAFATELLDRVNRLPGVMSAAVVNSLPIAGFEAATLFRIEGRAAPQQIAGSPFASQRVVSPTYFRTMGIPLRGGREFTDRDTPATARVAIVSESVAARYFRAENPIGKRIQLDDPTQPWLTVVGVVGDVLQSGLDADPGVAIYVPFLQDSWSVMSLVVRTQSNPIALGPVVRRQVWAIDPNQPVARLSTLDDIVSGSLSARRFQLATVGSFAAVALVLALVGVYAVISYSVVQRTNEIAIRVALGARPRRVLTDILSHGLRVAAISASVGLGVAVVVTRGMSGLLFEIQPTDPSTFVAVWLAVVSTSVLASYLPARRASHVDPGATLRA